jgi:hypothetical protein
VGVGKIDGNKGNSVFAPFPVARNYSLTEKRGKAGFIARVVATFNPAGVSPSWDEEDVLPLLFGS